MLSPKARRNISRIIPFGVIWLVFSIVYAYLEKGLLADLDYYPSTNNPYSFSRNIFITPVFACLTGLLLGVLEITYFNKLFRQKSFTRKMIYKVLVYLGLIVLFLILVTYLGNYLEMKTSLFDEAIWNYTKAFVFSYSFWSVALYMGAIIVVSQFYTEVSENIGQTVLANFFTGKYHRPIEEERIFMFLDMRSSTQIAEQLGHVKYFSMLREYYADLSDPIIRYSGEIYQYVGDEIVVSWKLKNGLRNNNCIQCFFAMKEAVGKKTAKYNSRFGLTPAFKAGFHYGKVTTGEIGVIKKEIIFTGDVLNTTSRVQGLCNAYNVDILISGQLIHALNPGPPFKAASLGENELRGRDEKIELFTIAWDSQR